MPDLPGKNISRRTFLQGVVLGAAGMMAGPQAVWHALAGDAPQPAAQALTGERWAASTGLNIAIHSPGAPVKMLTYSGNDFKPSWSPDGGRLTFFRATRYGADFRNWRSKICVINADGTGFRELTRADYPDFNPTWTRDGSNRIIFNRFSPTGDSRNQVFWIPPAGSPGDEVMLSDPEYPHYEWANSGLRDGRIFIDRLRPDGAFSSFLLTPHPGGRGVYEEIERPTILPWHKLSVSPSETKVAYMLDRNNDIPSYEDAVICCAEFDLKARRIHKQTQITRDGRNGVQEYPAWSRNEDLILYDSNETGTYAVYAYRLADGAAIRLSAGTGPGDQFADCEGLPK